MSKRMKGTVKWFNTTKAFSFISPDDGNEDLFVHQSAIKSDGYRSLNEGDTVEFVVSFGNDGRTKAIDVTALGGAMLSSGSRPSESDRGGHYGGGGDRGYDGGYGGGGRGGRGCYKCGEEGHMARDCSQGGGGGYHSGGGGGRGCYSYGEEGHMVRDCPNKNY